ncbi:MAG: hypothetical protein OQL19_10985 [Gammaproteobacteria bacterium]|nr:hypothetical protein [Gammaproteobacteria bacterium]
MKNFLIGILLFFIFGIANAGDEICITGISGLYSVKTPSYSAIINHQPSNKHVMHIRFNNNNAYEYAMFFDNGNGDVKILRGNLSHNACDQGNVYINGLTDEYEYEITKKCPSKERKTGFNVRNLPLNYASNQTEASQLLKLHREINLNIDEYLKAEVMQQSLNEFNIRRLR